MLASAWAMVAADMSFPLDFEGTATPEAHQASEAIQNTIREHIIATKDMRLFSLLHLLGQASTRMEQTLWPEEFERIAKKVREGLQAADDPNTKTYSQEEVMQRVQALLHAKSSSRPTPPPIKQE